MKSTETPTVFPTCVNGKILAWHSGADRHREWSAKYGVWINPGDYVVEDPNGKLWLVNCDQISRRD